MMDSWRFMAHEKLDEQTGLVEFFFTAIHGETDSL